MKKSTASFCSQSNAGADFLASKRKVLHVKKRGNTISVPEARFLPNGVSHNITVILDKSGGGKLTLKIDGETFCTKETDRVCCGLAELSIDGLKVDFVWNVGLRPRSFSFHTSMGGTSSSSSSDDENDVEPLDYEVKWKNYKHHYSLVIYAD